MQRILTARQMREADRLTSEEHGVPGMTLMENAGGRVYELLAHHFAPLSEHHVVILCGKGNNGGDGMVVARKIATRHAGSRLDVVLFGEPGRLRPDAAANYQALLGIDIQPTIVTDAEKWRELLPRLEGSTLVVDALLGTGMRGAAEGLYADVIGDLNTRFPRAQVVAVDMPSGMPPDTGEPAGPSVRAGHTVTFTAPKPSQVFPPNCFQAGALTVAPIGTAASVIESIPNLQLSLVEARDFASLFVPRPPASHKGDYGHLLVIGGSLRIGRVEGDFYNPEAPCFVALSARRTIARQQMQAVEAAAEKGFHFLVKDHPMYPLEIRETEHIRRATGTLTEQSSLSAVFYSTGTSGLEALLAGLPTFRLLPEDQIAVDVLPEFVSAQPVTAKGLAEALAGASRPAPVNWEDVLSPVDWNLWQRLLGGNKQERAA